MNGILLVDKPVGPTSHDVVARVRRAAGQRKVGHAGTLDPLASGLLVLALGRATRTVEYLTDHDKEYEAVVVLGQTTATFDGEGEILTRHEGPLPGRDEVAAMLVQFRGGILQRPPLFSAIKVDGEPLYQKARRGERVRVTPRPVTIHHLTLTEWAPPLVGLHVRCSKGTYIRSLAHDLGASLGVGAYLKQLRRTASGPFTLEHALSLDEIDEMSEAELEGALLPLGSGLDELDARTVSAAEVERLRHGQALPADEGEGIVRLVDEQGALVAIARWREDRGWKPEKVFVD